MQLNGTKNIHFVGLFLANLYASQVDISFIDDTESIVKFKTIGGNLDFYVFNG